MMAKFVSTATPRGPLSDGERDQISTAKYDDEEKSSPSKFVALTLIKAGSDSG